MPSRLMRRSGIAAVHISKLLKWSPSTVIQAGVGLHWEEVDCIKEQWPNVHFIGFEPNPHLFKKLKDRYPGDLFQLAVSNESGEADLFYRRSHKDGSSLCRLHENNREQVNVSKISTTTFDEQFLSLSSFAKPVLLWLDCEGSELKALRGGEELLKSVDMINVEMTGKPSADGWCKPQDVHDFLVDAEFKIQYLHTFRSAQGQYDAVYVRPHMFRSEYCSFPCRCGR